MSGLFKKILVFTTNQVIIFCALCNLFSLAIQTIEYFSLKIKKTFYLLPPPGYKMLSAYYWYFIDELASLLM